MTPVIMPRAAACSTATAVVLMLAACGGAPDAGEADTAEMQPAPVAPSVTITQPANDAVIDGNSVLVMLEVSDLRIVPAGTQEDGTGHHHLRRHLRDCRIANSSYCRAGGSAAVYWKRLTRFNHLREPSRGMNAWDFWHCYRHLRCFRT